MANLTTRASTVLWLNTDNVTDAVNAPFTDSAHLGGFGAPGSGQRPTVVDFWGKKALRYAGSQYIQNAASAVLDAWAGTKNFSISFIVINSGNGSGPFQTIFSRESNASQSSPMWFAMNGSLFSRYDVSAFTNGGGQGYPDGSGTTYTVNTGIPNIVTYTSQDNGNGTITEHWLVNGSVASTRTNSNLHAVDTSVPWTIGSNPGSNWTFGGDIAQMWFDNVPITASQQMEDGLYFRQYYDVDGNVGPGRLRFLLVGDSRGQDPGPGGQTGWLSQMIPLVNDPTGRIVDWANVAAGGMDTLYFQQSCYFGLNPLFRHIVSIGYGGANDIIYGHTAAAAAANIQAAEDVVRQTYKFGATIIHLEIDCIRYNGNPAYRSTINSLLTANMPSITGQRYLETTNGTTHPFGIDGDNADNTNYYDQLHLLSGDSGHGNGLVAVRNAAALNTLLPQILPNVATPVISPANNSTILTTDTVTISCTTSGAAIHYTTDGSDPTSSSPLYNTGFTLSAGAKTVKAIAIKASYNDSGIAAATYTVNPADTTAPTVTAEVLASDGVTLTITTSEATTGTTGFVVKVGGVTRSANVARTDSTHLVLTLASAAYSTDAVTLDYAPGNVADLASNALVAFSARAVTNNSTQSPPDTTPPTVTSAVLASDGVTLTITLSEATTGNSGFTAKVGGNARSTVVARPDQTHVVLTLASAAYGSDTVTLDYAPGNVDDMASNALVAFTGHAVTNNSTQTPPDTTPPTVTAAVLASDGVTLTVTLSEATTGTTGLVVKVNGTPRSASVARTDSTHLSLDLSSVSYQGDTVTLDYAPGNIADLASNALVAFSAHSVTNNSTQPAPDTTAPTISNAVLGTNGVTLTLTTSEATTGTTGFSVKVAGTTRSATINRTDSTHLVLTLASAAYTGQAVTFSYDANSGNVADTSSNALASVSNAAVTNNSNVAAPGNPTVTNVTAAPGALSIKQGTWDEVTGTVFGANSPDPGVTWAFQESGSPIAGCVVAQNGDSGARILIGPNTPLGTIHVVGTSVQDGSKTVVVPITVTTATVTPVTPTVEAVTIPAVAPIAAPMGGTIRLFADVLLSDGTHATSADIPTPVFWTLVAPQTGFSIDSDGTLHYPASTPAGSQVVQVRATSVDDDTKVFVRSITVASVGAGTTNLSGTDIAAIAAAVAGHQTIQKMAGCLATEGGSRLLTGSGSSLTETQTLPTPEGGVLTRTAVGNLITTDYTPPAD